MNGQQKITDPTILRRIARIVVSGTRRSETPAVTEASQVTASGANRKAFSRG